jgi:hypothetical protein
MIKHFQLRALMLFSFFTASAQEIRYSEVYYANADQLEATFSSLTDATFVLLAEEDYYVRHQLKFSQEKDSIIYLADFFEYSEPYKEQLKFGLVDLVSIKIEENQFTNPRLQLVFTTKPNKTNKQENYYDSRSFFNYVSEFKVPINSAFNEADLQNIQESFLSLKNELTPFQPKADSTKIKTARFHVKEAVLQSLLAVQPRLEEIKKLSKNNTVFVSKCQICLGVQDALKAYIRTPTTELLEIIVLFDSDNDEELYDELQEFVEGSVQHYLSHPNFNDAEITLIQDILEKERMNSVQNFKITACAACDGAVNN